jgi:hypothetical protein
VDPLPRLVCLLVSGARPARRRRGSANALTCLTFLRDHPPVIRGPYRSVQATYCLSVLIGPHVCSSRRGVLTVVCHLCINIARYRDVAWSGYAARELSRRIRASSYPRDIVRPSDTHPDRENFTIVQSATYLKVKSSPKCSPQYHYVCSHRRRHGSGACPHARFHKAEEIEGRVREFIYRLLHDPEALRRQTLLQLERDRASLGRVEEEAGILEEQIAEADRERDGYLRLAARSRISEGELDRYLAELEQRKEAARRELEGLRDRRRRLSELDELAREVDAYLADLPNLVDREPVVREYETAPPEPDDGGRLPIYELAPQHIRRRSEQEVAELRERRERERAERYRAVYRLLTLRVVAHRDGTLEVSGTFGGQSLPPEEPRALELPPFDCPAHVLSSSSDSHR